MSVYLDAITMVMCVLLLFPYAKWLAQDPNKWSILGFLCLSIYLLAQVGWTTAWISGDLWGRDLSNYIWFSFNTLACVVLYYIWRDRG